MNTTRSAQYKKPFIIAIVLHIVLFIFLIIHFNFFTKDTATQKSVPIINASVVETPQPAQPTSTPVPVIQSKPTPTPLPKPVPKQEDQKQEKEEALQHALQERALALKKAEAQKELEIKQQKALEKQRQAAIKKRHEADLERQLANELKQDQSLVKTKTEKKAPIKHPLENEQALQQEITAEQTAMQAQKAKALSQGEIDKYTNMIKQAVSKRWIIPENTDNTLTCKLKIRLAPGGVVLDVQVVESSGNAALDRSARAAVMKASPLPVPSDTDLFDQFRELNLTMKPETKV